MLVKKTVKEQIFNLANIQTISIETTIADINISLVDNDELKVTQYSQKKVDTSFQYDTKIDGVEFLIIDNSKQVQYFLGVKGNPGISYEIQLPKSYSGRLNIVNNQGNIVIKSGDSICHSETMNIEITGSGDINIGTLLIAGNSLISTERGNINITLSQDIDCKVTANAESGNISVSEKFADGLYDLLITSKQGNIVVQ